MSFPRVLQVIGRPVFTTREVAQLRACSLPSAAQALRRMERDGLVVRVTRGVWCVPADSRFTPFALVPMLAGGHLAYVSFLTALHLHGVIEQIPQVIYAATTGHTHTVKTAVGAFSFHQISADLFAGYLWRDGSQSYLLATPEKALVDCLYLSSRKGNRFGHLPAFAPEAKIKKKLARGWARRIPNAGLRGHVSKKLEELLGRG